LKNYPQAVALLLILMEEFLLEEQILTIFFFGNYLLNLYILYHKLLSDKREIYLLLKFNRIVFRGKKLKKSLKILAQK